MKTFTQEQVDQGDAFGMTLGKDYTVEMPEGDQQMDDDDMGPMDVDLSDAGIPQLEGDKDGGKPKDSDSQEDDEESDEDKKDADDTDGDNDEADADADADAGDKPADDDDGDKDVGNDDASEPKLPKFRYDQQKAKAERLAEENRQLQADLAAARAERAAPAKEEAKPAEPTREQTLLEEKMDDLLVKKNEALIDGDAKAAAKFEREMMSIQRDINSFTAKAEPKAKEVDTQELKAQMRAELRAEQEMDAVLDNIEAEYDVLNEKHEAYDPKMVARVLRMQRVGIEDGLSPVEALVEAAETVLAGVPTNTEKASKPAAKPAAKKTDVKKNLKAAKSQPPSLSDDVGDDSDAAGLQDELPDIDKLTDKEFDALPKHIQDRMMGNTLH